MRIDIIAVIPEMLDGFLHHSIIQKAKEKKVVEIAVHSLREFGEGTYRQIDDYAYGGEAGMVLMPGPLSKIIENLKEKVNYDEVIFLCPDGKPLQQKMVNSLSLQKNLLMICGRYKGIDERIRELYVTMEISIGDYVISGGELAACVLTDAIVRVIPGAISDSSSALSDSFQSELLSPPVYTRPANFKGLEVPDVLLSGHHQHINQWKSQQIQSRTKSRRPDLLR